MTKRVQILGHPAEVANQFIGLERELTVDTDNEELRLHDGATPGGQKILNRDANDERYQARSVELDGLLGWEPNQRGFTARLGPQTYRLRSITVNNQQLEIENANGYDGNPLIGFAATITTDHTWTGIHTYSQAIQADGGLDGETRGHHVGNVDGNLTGNTFGHHTGTAEGDFTGTYIGDVDVRGKTLELDDGQIQLSWLSAEIIELIVNAGLPVGSCIPFYGAIGEIPTNWRICDGTFGTPDLRGRFVLAVSDDHTAFTSGGSETHIHNVDIAGGTHNHTGTVGGHVLSQNEMPSHFHYEFAPVGGAYNTLITHPEAAPNVGASGSSSGASYNIGGDSAFDASIGRSSSVGDNDAHTHSLTIDGPAGSHTHNTDTSEVSNMPPFFSMIYIMKGA